MTNQEEQNLIDYLFAEKCSCVLRNGNEIRVFRGRGVADLYRLLKEEPEFLDEAFIVDKVVGKAAAALGREATGKVAVELSTGEPGGHNFLQPALIKELL